jgi:anaerobic magnesium-protoporphyrin IX monomethyl ester cyclase
LTANNSFVSTSKEILFVFPGKYNATNPQVPLALLHLANPLLNEGYKVKILDMRITNYRNTKIGNPIFVGITCMSGHQIKYGLEFAKKLRHELPACPIVWGGVHPTLLPEQTAQNSYVDIVVRGEGEETILELANKLYTNQPINEVKGITYQHQGKINSNPDRKFIDLNELSPTLPYYLLIKEKYPSLQAGRIHIQTSRGCPHKCKFCYNSIFNNTWRSKKAERIIEEISVLQKEFSNLKCIDIIDDNFFVDKERVIQVCNGLIQGQNKISWRANCRFDYLDLSDKKFFNLLEKSNCKELNLGAETGSERLLTFIKKDVSTNQMLNALQKLQRWAPSIEPYVFWMSGYPTETKEDLNQTFQVMDNLINANSKTQHIEMYVFTPFPSKLLEELKPQFKPPQLLEEWGDIDIFHFKPPWHTKKYVRMLEDISAVTRYVFYPKERIRELALHYRAGYWVLNKMAQFRWRHKYFRFAFELKIANIISIRVKGY